MIGTGARTRTAEKKFGIRNWNLGKTAQYRNTVYIHVPPPPPRGGGGWQHVSQWVKCKKKTKKKRKDKENWNLKSKYDKKGPKIEKRARKEQISAYPERRKNVFFFPVGVIWIKDQYINP
jgi:hypothetical protein